MECIFKGLLASCSADKQFEANPLSQIRKDKIVSSSHQRKDKFHEQIEEISSDKRFHSHCYREYTSKEKIARWLKKVKNKEANSSPPTKRLRRYFLLITNK